MRIPRVFLSELLVRVNRETRQMPPSKREVVAWLPMSFAPLTMISSGVLPVLELVGKLADGQGRGPWERSARGPGRRTSWWSGFARPAAQAAIRPPSYVTLVFARSLPAAIRSGQRPSSNGKHGGFHFGCATPSRPSAQRRPKRWCILDPPPPSGCSGRCGTRTPRFESWPVQSCRVLLMTARTRSSPDYSPPSAMPTHPSAARPSTNLTH